MSFHEESTEIWESILKEDFDFNSRELLIEALEQVSLQDVNAKFDKLFMTSSRRLNVKLWSQNHLENEEIGQANQANDDFYKAYGIKKTKIENPILFNKS